MKKRTLRSLSAFFATLFLLTSLLAILPAAAANGDNITISGGKVTNVKWNYGYVGSTDNTEGNINKIATKTVSSVYRYSDVMTIPKAGTTLAWSEPVASKLVSRTAYIISSWKKNGSNWEFDENGVNVSGGQRAFYTTTSDIVTYFYTTSKDNEHIRISYYGEANSSTHPTVYAGTSNVSSGKLNNILWLSGYVASGTHGTVSLRNTINAGGAAYTYSAPILIKKAGTTVSFDVTKGNYFASDAAYVFSIWNPENDGSFSIGYGMPGNASKNTAWQTINGNTCSYFYTSSTDNEYIRICYRSEAAANALPTSFPTVSVTENSGKDPILATAYYDAQYREFVLGNVKWNDGYVGSADNADYPNQIASSNSYKYTNIITVYGKGSLVMFTDPSGFASKSSYTISSWSSDDNETATIKANGTNYNGTNTASYTKNPDGSRTYYYYTKSDVEYIRICLRSDAANRGSVNTTEPAAFIAPAIYAITSAKLITWKSNYYVMGNPNASSGYALYSLNYNTSYMYTEEFTVPQSGTTIKLPLNQNSSNDIAVFSSYDADHQGSYGTAAFTPLTGSYSVINSSRLYSYTTVRDNETLRLCANAAYNPTVGNYFKPILVSTLGSYKNVFAGKEITIIGDSYFYGNYINKNKVWPKLLSEVYGMTFYNQGINGSTVSNGTGASNPMVDRVSAMKGSASTDIVLFEGGRNDYNKSIPIGTKDSSDTTTFYGAVKSVISQLRTKFPNAIIICLNAWDLTGVTANNANTAGHTCNEYAAAFKNYVDTLGDKNVAMLNTNSTSVVPVYIKQAAFRELYGQTSSDISHMNANGMNFALPYFEASLGKLLETTALDRTEQRVFFKENDRPAVIFSTSAASTVTAPTPVVKESFIGWGGEINGKKLFIPAGSSLALNENDKGSLTAYYMTLNFSGTTVRLNPDSTGIRFITKIAAAEYNAIADFGVTMQRGTLIVPYDYLKKLGNLSFESINTHQTKYLNVEANDWYNTEGAYVLLAGSISNMLEENYTRNFIGRGYVTLTYTDGSTATFYAKNNAAGRYSIYALSLNAYEDRTLDKDSSYIYSTPDGNYSRYTASQLSILDGFISRVLVIESDAAAPYGFTAKMNGSGKNNTYNVYFEGGNANVLEVSRADGAAIQYGEIVGIYLKGSSATFRMQDGKALVTYSAYTDGF